MSGGLTRAQRLALALDRNLSVTAGAGTGKTRVLTRRFLRILAGARDVDALGSRGGARPGQVVAVTFTRKAANEMRERVSREVTKAVRAAQEAQDAGAFAFWVGVRRELEEATISTIHGLAARLVRLSALDLGVDPRFRVVEGIDARLLVEEAVSSVLADVPEAARESLRELYVLRGAHGVRGMLRALVSDRVHADAWAGHLLRGGVDGVLDWAWNELVAVDEEEREGVVRALEGVHEGLVSRVKVAPEEGSKAQVFLQALAGAAARAPRRESLQAIWSLLQVCTSTKGEWYKAANYATGPAREWDAMGVSGGNKQVYADLGAVLEPLLGRLVGVPGNADRRMLRMLEGLARVYRAVLDRYDTAKARRGLLDYHDLEVLARQALARPGVKQALCRQTRYLLVDEFQDTNENQWAILKALAGPSLDDEASIRVSGSDVEAAGGWASAEELQAAGPGQREHAIKREQDGPAGGGLSLVEIADEEPVEDEALGEDRLFIVGDAKQSVYSFRGADVTVYESSREAVRAANVHHGLDQEPPDLGDPGERELVGACTVDECEGEVRLDRNFRSLPALVRFANRFFDRLLAPEDPEKGRERFEARPGPLAAERAGLLAADEDNANGAQAVAGSVRLLVSPRGLDAAVARGDLTNEEAQRYGSTRIQFARLVQDIRSRVQGPPEARLRVHAGASDADTGPEPSRPARYKDIAVLLPRRTNLRLLEEQFRSNGVPYVVVGGRGFWSRQEVWDAVNLLAVVAQPRRDVEMLCVLRSAFFAWSDESLAALASVDGASLWQRLCRIADHEAEWEPPTSFAGVPPGLVVERVRDWRRRAQADSAAGVLIRVLEETPYLASLSAHEPEASGRLGVENLEKLVSLVRGLENRRGRSLEPLVRDLLALCEEDAEEAEAVLPGEEQDGVRVMTVHAAKGLEFPVVYVAELDAQLQSGSLGDVRGVEFDRVRGVPLFTMRARGEDGEVVDPLLNQVVSRRARLRSRAEYKRLFYVAVTRAQDHLVLVGCSERYGAKKGQSPPAIKPLRAGRSWMDWVEHVLGLDHEAYAQIVRETGRCRPVAFGDDSESALVTVDADRAVLEDHMGLRADAQVHGSDEAGGRPLVQVAPRPVDQKPPAVRVSPSQLLVYAECHARFRYRVLEGLSEGRVRRAKSRAPPYGEAFGSLLHRALGSGTDEGDVPADVLGRGRALARRYEGAGWPSPAQVEKQLVDHAARARKALQERLDPRPVLVESTVDAEVAPGLRVVGRLDRVHRDRDGRLVVVDLKTDTVEPGQEDQHARRRGHDAQVLLYDAALRCAGEDPAPAGLLYSATGALVRVGESGADESIEHLAKRIEASRALPADAEREDAMDALWPRSAQGLETCEGCGFFRDNGGPCAGTGS